MTKPDIVSFRELPVLLDEDTLWKRLRVKEDSDETEKVRRIIEQAQNAAHPRGMVRECRIEDRYPGGVTIEGEHFNSRLLRWQFDDIDVVHPFVLTVGDELEELKPPDEELLERFWWDEVKTAIMRGAHIAMQKRMAKQFGTPESMAFLSPGSGDVGLWSVEDVALIFRLLGDVEGGIGVRLTRSCCMIPRHTISGLHYPRTSDFVTCKVCRQSHCPDRLAPFNRSLWEQFKPGRRQASE